MSVADVLRAEPARTELGEHALAREPVVDLTRCRTTQGKRLRPERHWCEGSVRVTARPENPSPAPRFSARLWAENPDSANARPEGTHAMSDQPPAHPSAHQPGPGPSKPGASGAKGPLSATFPATADLPYDVVCYGPAIGTEAELRLLGDLEGRRVLDLGCGGGHAAVAMAQQGAHVVAVDPSAENIGRVRAAAEKHEVRVETHQSDLADLPFLRADSVDLAYSAHALATVPDLSRTFRQIHRVLRTDSHLVFSLPHPAFGLIEAASNDPLRIKHAYWDAAPRPWEVDGRKGEEHPHTVSEVFTDLTRAGFRVDVMMEPEPRDEGPLARQFTEIMRWVPATLLLRARKEGI